MDCLLSSYALWFVWPAVIGILVYWYFTKDHDYWKKRNVPYVPPVPFAGSLFRSFSKIVHETELERYRKYGRLYGYYEGSRPVLTIAHPDLLRKILVKDFSSFANRRKVVCGDPVTDCVVSNLDDEEWKRVRSIITPTFSTRKLKGMMNIFIDCAEVLSKNLSDSAKKGMPIDVRSYFGAYTMDVIASSAFSTKLDSHNDPKNRFVVLAQSVFGSDAPWRFVLFYLFPSFVKFFRIRIFSPESMDFFRDLTLQVIEERKKSGQTRNDFLQLLMDTAKEEGIEEAEDKDNITSNYEMEDNSHIFKQYYKNKTLSKNELVAQCVNFFLGGYENTALTMCFAAYNLALHPDCQEKVIREVDAAIQEAGGHITYEAIQKMRYLDNTISETLRLYPIALRFERLTGEDYQLGDTGLTIPKGMIVGFPIYAMHRDPEFFPDPEKFDPDRFIVEAKSSRDPFTYMPFGAGPRNCVAMRFVLLKVKVSLAYVFSSFRIKRCSETKVPLEFFAGQGRLQPKEVNLMFEIRTDSVLG